MPGYKKEESAPHMDQRLMARLTQKKKELDRYRPLAESIVGRLHDDLRIILTYHSNAIEGNSFSLNETKMVLETGISIGGHSLREHLEVTNHAEAFDLLRSFVRRNQEITVPLILELHRLVMGKIDKSAGSLRQGSVHIVGAPVTTPSARQLPSLVEEWVSWVNGSGLSYDTIVRAAIAHHGFESLHPFYDGNGRTGRLILNLMLMEDGYPPALLLKDWRSSYISGLSAADKGNYTPLLGVIGRAVEGGLDLYLSACRAGPVEPDLSLAALAEGSTYSVNYLGLLARLGHLEATKRGRKWYSSRAALARYEEEVESGAFPAGRPRR